MDGIKNPARGPPGRMHHETAVTDSRGAKNPKEAAQAAVEAAEAAEAVDRGRLLATLS